MVNLPNKSNTKDLSILACQIDIPDTHTIKAKLQHLTSTATKTSERLSQNPADILVLPELSSLSYCNTTFSNLSILAEDDHGDSYQTWSQIAKQHQCFVVYGYARKHGLSDYSIATGVIDSLGQLVAVYDKLHLAQFGQSVEKEYFNIAGNHLVVFECRGFRLAPIICYDIRFAELCSSLAVKHNVDCILHTGAYARDPSFDSWHAFAKTRAMENQIYLLSLNRAGSNFGNSVLMPPWVDSEHRAIHFHEIKEHYQLLTLTKEAIKQARHDYHFVEDRLFSYKLPVSNCIT